MKPRGQRKSARERSKDSAGKGREEEEEGGSGGQYAYQHHRVTEG